MKIKSVILACLLLNAGTLILKPPSYATDKSTTMIYSIDRLTTELSSNPLWMNGAYPLIKLSEKAKHDEVIAECIKMTGFDEGHVKDYKIIKIKTVKIRGPLPEDYFAALMDTDLGKKIVLFKYVNFTAGWWTRVYDLK